MIAQIGTNAAVLAATYVVVAVGFSLAFRALRYYYITFAALATASAFVAEALIASHRVATYGAVTVATAVSVSIALLDYAFTYYLLGGNRATSLTKFVASTAVYIAVSNVVLAIGGPEARTFATVVGRVEVLPFGNARISLTSAWVVGVAVAFALVAFLIDSLPFGTAIAALSDNEMLAAVVGIHANRVRVIAVIGSAILASVGGIVIGMNQSVRFDMGMPLALKAILATMLGGGTAMRRAILGSVLLAALETLITLTPLITVRDVISYAVLAALLLMRSDRQALLQRTI